MLFVYIPPLTLSKAKRQLYAHFDREYLENSDVDHAPSFFWYKFQASKKFDVFVLNVPICRNLTSLF